MAGPSRRECGRLAVVAEPTSHLIDELRKIERTTASISANMDTLLAHLGIPGATEEEVDRILNQESRAVPGKHRAQL